MSCVGLSLLLAFANVLLYPGTRTLHARSSAPDALIEPARRMAAGGHPYAGVLFDGAPISPGPGWIAIHAPLTAVGLVWLVVPLIVLVPALGVLLSRVDRRAAAIFCVVAGGTALGVQLAVWTWGVSLGLPYQPLHVFGRAARSGALVVPIGLGVSIAVAMWQWIQGTNESSDWLRFVWAITGAPFVAVGIGELVGPTNMQWSIWEGKVYVAFALPLLVAAVSLRSVARAEHEGYCWDHAEGHGSSNPAVKGE